MKSPRWQSTISSFLAPWILQSFVGESFPSPSEFASNLDFIMLHPQNNSDFFWSNPPVLFIFEDPPVGFNGAMENPRKMYGGLVRWQNPVLFNDQWGKTVKPCGKFVPLQRPNGRESPHLPNVPTPGRISDEQALVVGVSWKVRYEKSQKGGTCQRNKEKIQQEQTGFSHSPQLYC